MRDTEIEREAETQAEGEAGPMQGANRGTRSQASRIRPRAEGGAKPLSHPGCPASQPDYFNEYSSVSSPKVVLFLFFLKIFIYLFMRDTERERGRDTGRGRSRLHARRPTWDLTPGLQDQALG